MGPIPAAACPTLEELEDTPRRWVTRRVGLGGRKWSVSGGPATTSSRRPRTPIGPLLDARRRRAPCSSRSRADRTRCVSSHVLGRLGSRPDDQRRPRRPRALRHIGGDRRRRWRSWAAEAGHDVHIARAQDLEGPNLHARARAFRYSFFETIAREVGAGRIATGHTLDDRVETTLARLIHGAGTEGLAGIPPVDGEPHPSTDRGPAQRNARVLRRGRPRLRRRPGERRRALRPWVGARSRASAIEDRWGEGAVRAMASAPSNCARTPTALAIASRRSCTPGSSTRRRTDVR